ncbi:MULTISPECIES: hypothetical protein [Pirellulaceae]|uniref:hypothetical protein n=1 Tax=Pirellulaceae TaxID=2691357 RepID=UPI0011B066BC|nr:MULTISPECIES: hypothetical protein [Pirellulaceae]
MHQKHFQQSAVLFLSLVCLIATHRGAVAEKKLDTAEILAVAKASFKTDEDTLWQSRLKGRFEITGKDGLADKQMFTTFESWVVGDTLRNNSLCDFERSTFPYARFEDVRTLLLENGSLYVTSFSDRFKPIGCETRIRRHEFDTEMLHETHFTVWYHPQMLLKLPFNPTREGVDSMTFTKDNNGILHGTWHPNKNARCEIQLNSRIGNRPISNKIYYKDKLVHEINATWKQWPNAGTMLESVTNTYAAQSATYTWTLTEFESLKAVNPNKFQQADLGALPGAREIDERDRNNVLINGRPIR